MFSLLRRFRVGLILPPPLFGFLLLALACGSSEPSTLDVLRQAFTPNPETEQIQRTVGPRDFEWLAYGHEAQGLYQPVPCPSGIRLLPGAGCMQGRLVNTLPFTLERVRVICESSAGVRSGLIFAHDPAPGESTEWTWMHAPMEAEFACHLDWRVPSEVMRE